MKRLTRSSGIGALDRGRERDQRAMRRSRSRSAKSAASASTRRESIGSRSKSQDKSPPSGKKGVAARAGPRKKERSRDGSDSNTSRQGQIARRSRTRDSIDDTVGNESTSASESKRRDSKNRLPPNKRKVPSRRSATLSNGHADEVQSPVREISFTREDSETGHLRRPPKKKRRLSPSELDICTLEAVKDYIGKNKVADTLQDDEVAQFMLRVDRNTRRQADYQLHLVGDSADESDASLFEGIVECEQDYSIGHDMFKSMVATLRKVGKQALDSRTLRWIKRAAGIRRPPVISLARQHAIETDTSRMIKTRTTSRRSRAQKKEVGLKYLIRALHELEPELQPQASRQKAPPPKPSVESTRTAPTHGIKNGSSLRKVQAASTRHTTRPTILLARILQQRQFISGTTGLYLKDVSITGIVLNGKRVRREQVASWKGEPRKRKANKENVDFSNSLKYREWQRRQATSLFNDEAPADLLDPYFRKRVDEGRTSSLIQADVVCRLPAWDAVKEGLSSVLHPPRLRCSVEEYASLCLKLMNSLSGPARSWSISEFFYSDIDRPWFNHNSFVEIAAAIRINPSARLTTSEWKAVRRQMRTKPRRFSKRFIEAQLGERNEFRRAVRMRQRSPLVDGMKSLPYDVPALIQTGATVTAYCRRFRILQRGTVIGYDATKATYWIQFDDAKFGTENCPDSEVASHGGARVLIEVRTSITSPSAYGNTSLLPTGSSKASLHVLESRPRLAVGSEVHNALCVPNQRNTARVSSNDVLSEAAERDMLIHLLGTLEAAIQRKDHLLGALDAANAQHVTNLPFGDGDIVSISEPDLFIKSHVSWLLANLEETNEVISATLKYMRPIYHMARTPPKHEDDASTQQLVEKGLQHVASEKLPAADASLDWARRLTEDAIDIGRTLSAPSSSEPDSRDSRDGSAMIATDSRDGSAMIATAGAVLLATSCCKAIAAAPVTTGHHDPSPGVLNILVHELLECSDDNDVAMSSLPTGGETLRCVQRERSLAVEDLKGALSMLNAELAVASAVLESRSSEAR